MDYSTIIDRLDDDIRQFRIEYHRFFNGDVPTPPEERRIQIRKHLKSLIGQPQLSAVDQFRLGALEGRYNSLAELFRRRLRDMNFGHGASAPAASLASDQGTTRRAVVDLAGHSPVDDVEQLYEAIYAGRSKRVDIHSFHAYLLDRASEVRQRTGCEKVRFSIDGEAGRQKLKARPLRP